MKQVSSLLYSPLQPYLTKIKLRFFVYKTKRSAVAFFLLTVIAFTALFFTISAPSLIQAESPPEIDSFDTVQPPLSLIAQEDIQTTAFSAVSGLDILGGERDMEIGLTGGTKAGFSLVAGVDSGTFSLASGPGIEGFAELVWDGPDGDPVVDYIGLGGKNLTARAKDAFLLQVSFDDLPANPIIEVFTDSGNSSAFTLPLPGAITTAVDYVIPFSAFDSNLGSGADFTNVGAITLFITATTSLDMAIDTFETSSLLTATKVDVLLIDNDGDGQSDAGDILQYTVTVANPDDAFDQVAAGVVFNDTPDLNTTLLVGSVATTQGTITSGNSSGNTGIEVGIGSFEDGDSVTITFETAINNPLPDGVTEVANQGFISSDTLTDRPTDDPDTDVMDDATITPVVLSAPAITTTKSDTLIDNGDSQLGPGDTITYTIVITNDGDGPATGVVFNDTPDPNAVLVVGSVAATQGTVASGNEAGDTSVQVDVGDLTGAGGTVTITFEVAIIDPLPPGITEVTNQGVVSGDNFANVLTDDPETASPGDSTTTP